MAAASRSALVASAEARFAAIPEHRIAAALAPTGPIDAYECVQSRAGEEYQGVTAWQELRAIYTSKWFWDLASLLPRNDLTVAAPGRPKDYPDWLLFLLVCASGIGGVASYHAAVMLLSDKRLWVDFAFDVDRYVRPGMTRIHDLANNHPRRRARSKAQAKTSRTSRPVALAPRPDAIRRLIPGPPVPAPAPHHLDYFTLLWRGRDKQGNGLPAGHPWAGLRQRILAQFSVAAVAQAQEMGMLDHEQALVYNAVDRRQFIGGDGVVMPMRPKLGDTSCGEHTVGGRKATVHGSKWTIFSIRISGQYMSRLILDFGHTGRDPLSRGGSETDIALTVIPTVRTLTKGGLKGVIFDSAIRGNAVIELQRGGTIVVNYPHAASNPDGGAGRRLNPTRREKSHIHRIATHHDRRGRSCEHVIYAVGGELLQLIDDANGDPAVRRLDVDKYQQRHGKGGGPYREYVLVTITCPGLGNFTDRVPLFHHDPVSTDPEYNRGEVVRVFPPSSPQFRYLYGARNDTESRHNSLKTRAKYLPHDVAGQQLRLLGAAVTSNAVAWQIHLQAYGQPNVFDDTA